jgi:hypothetical protein
LADNPLCTFWPAAEARRKAQLPWLRRSPGLTVLGILLAVYAAAANVLLLLHLLDLRQVTPRHVLVFASGGLAQIVLGGVLFCGCWYLARLFAALQTSFGLLDASPRRSFQAVVDDPLLLTALTGPDLLLGTVVYGCRRVLPPLLLLCLALTLNSARLVWGELAGGSYGFHWYWLASRVAGLILMLAISGTLGTATLLLLAMGLGRGQRTAALPSIGAGVLLALQPVLSYAAAATMSTLHPARAPQGVAFYDGAAVALLLLLLWLAQRWTGLRSALAAGLPFGWMGLHLLVAGYVGSAMNWGNLPYAPAGVACGLLTPLDTTLWLAAQFHSAEPVDYVAVWYAALPIRLGLLLLAGWFAAAAVGLRQAGEL